MKIFVSAYACEPGLGSEIGVGWHWVLELAKEYEVWVLTRESNRKRIETWFSQNPGSKSPHFIYFDLPKWARFWKKGLRGVRTYYNIWTKLSNPLVKKTMSDNDIKVFHHITYGNALWEVSKFGSKQTLVWGPIGGLETIPEEFSEYYDRKSKLIEKIRRLAVRRAIKSKALKKRVDKADLILCKTEETRSLLPLKNKSKAILFTDVAADNLSDSPSSISEISHFKPQTSSSLSLLCVGRLDAWRGFDLAILALAEILKSSHSIFEEGGGVIFHLTIVGKGADRERLQKLVKENNLEKHVTFTGNVSREEYIRLMQETDIVLNPSLKEGAVTVSFDAMAMGKPLVALDTGGYTRYFKPDYSIVIQKEDRQTTINNLAKAISSLSDPKKREEMGDKAREAAKDFSWERHGEEIRRVFRELGES